MTNTNETDMKAAADTIVAQLGGRKIFAMAFTGASYDSSKEPPNVTLKVAPALVRGTKGKGTHVVITLDPSDTYTVKLVKCGTARTGYAITEVASCDGIYADMLRSTVESMTGLALTLGTMSAVRS